MGGDSNSNLIFIIEAFLNRIRSVMQFTKRDLHRNPRQSANWISVLIFGWTIPIFRRSGNKLFDRNGAFEPIEDDRSASLGDRLER